MARGWAASAPPQVFGYYPAPCVTNQLAASLLALAKPWQQHYLCLLLDDDRCLADNR